MPDELQMRRIPTISLVALIAAASPAAAQSVQDFRLPPEPTPTPTTQVEGPVDREGPVIIAPRVIPTGTATPTPRPTAAPTPAPTAARSTSTPRPLPTQSPMAQRPPAVEAPGQATVPSLPAEALPDAATPAIDSTATPLPAAPATATAAEEAEQAEEPQSGFDWLWWVLGLAAVAALALVGWFLRQRRTVALSAPAIERPRVPTPSPTAPPVAPVATSGPDLRVEAEAISLGRSFANATLSYSITVSNLGGQPLQNVRIEADMTTAHSSLPVDQQLASTTTELPDLAWIDQLAAGAAKQARGEFRLPVGQIRLIRQGKAALYVPLLRLRIHADGIEPVVRTFVVGQKQGARSGRLTPFRLDEMAQVYREIALQPLAPALG